MGLLVEGLWSDDEFDTSPTDGAFERPQTRFHATVAENGPYPPKAGRYVLYASWAYPWAHSALILLKLKGLEQAIKE